MNTLVQQVRARYGPLPRIAKAGGEPQEKAFSRFAALTGILFATAMMSVPWEDMAGRLFEDKEVYLERFTRLPSVIDEKQISTFLDFFLNEALWDVIVRAASDAFSAPVVLGAITFFCLFVFSSFIASRHGPLAVIMLVNPLLVDFAFSQLRLAFAIALVTLTLSMRRRLWMPIVVVFACFIHTAMILFIAMYWTASWLDRKFRQKHIPASVLGLSLLAIGTLVALLVGPFREGVLNAIGDRRAEYELGPATLLYASFWMALLAVIPLQKWSFYRSRSNLFAVTSLSAFVAATILGVFGTRFVAVAYPFAVSSILTLNRPFRQVLTIVFLVYTGAQWYYWFL